MSALNFTIFHPKGALSTQVQALWTASVLPSKTKGVERWLHGDACSGIVFNLGAPFYLNGKIFSSKILILPVSKQAQLIILSPGTRLVGIRFHPAISFGFLGKIYHQTTEVKYEDDIFDLYSIYNQLQQSIAGHYSLIVFLYKWIKMSTKSTFPPSSLIMSLNMINNHQKLETIPSYTAVGQRQIERQFQKWLNMTPKYYQRLIRVKNTLNCLKGNPDIELVELALQQGFTDQAHMTREFKEIAKVTPKSYCQQLVNHNT